MDRCFVAPAICNHDTDTHTHTHDHTHTHTQNIDSPLNLLVVHYDECYVIPLILTSRWLTPMNRLGRPSAAPLHRLVSNQQNTGKLRPSLQVRFRRRSRDPWKVQKELGRMLRRRVGAGGLGGDPETGGDGRAARLEEDPQNPQRRIPRFSFVY